MTGIFKSCVVLVLFCAFLEAQGRAKQTFSIQWKVIEPCCGGKVVLAYQEPTGFEDSNPLFLCRALHESYFTPGKVYLGFGLGYFCSIAKYGKEYRYTGFQMLEVPSGTTSWEPLRNALPSNAIVAGSHNDGENAYICRAKAEGHLLTGALWPVNLKCYLPRDEKEFGVTTGIEILVVNAYGKIRGL